MEHSKDNNVEKCVHCKTQRKYSEEYDAYYCSKCLYWLEKICRDRKCSFCKDRPKYPEGLTEKEIVSRIIEDVIMECKRTSTFSHADMIFSGAKDRLKLNELKYWDDYEKIRGLLEDYVKKPLCDSTELHKIVKKLIK